MTQQQEQDRAALLAEVCHLSSNGDKRSASRLIKERYPFASSAETKKFNYAAEKKMTRIFVRDGFLDRYSGNRLVFPGALRLLSNYLGDVFPYQSNWKRSECHEAYWDLCPTIDHITPVARGGSNDTDNLVSCSQLTNSQKSDWTLDERGWQMLPAGRIPDWDGLIHWFVQQVERDPAVRELAYIERWYMAAKDVLGEPHADRVDAVGAVGGTRARGRRSGDDSGSVASL